MFTVEKLESTENDRLKRALIPPPCVSVQLLCYADMQVFIIFFFYRTVVLLHMLFHGSFFVLIAYCERFPVRACILVQHPTWLLISYCWGVQCLL